MNTAIIVAAGSGQRFGGDTPKQFLDLGGKPMIARTLERFERCDAVDQIVLVVAPDYIDRSEIADLRSEISKLATIVAGGNSRAESVRNGLSALHSDCRIVAVHDAARPLVPVGDIERVIRAAEKFGAACLTAEITDTVKTIDGERITGTIDRTKLRKALTPQAFRFDILRKAFEENEDFDSATDECSLVERLGVEIIAIAGDPLNIKITTPADLEFARTCFE